MQLLHDKEGFYCFQWKGNPENGAYWPVESSKDLEDSLLFERTGLSAETLQNALARYAKALRPQDSTLYVLQRA
jgi:hypothetical protein